MVKDKKTLEDYSNGLKVVLMQETEAQMQKVPTVKELFIMTRIILTSHLP